LLFFNLLLVQPTLSYFLCLRYIVFKQQRQGLCFQWTNTLWAILKAFLESIAWSNGLMSRLDVLVGLWGFQFPKPFLRVRGISHIWILRKEGSRCFSSQETPTFTTKWTNESRLVTNFRPQRGFPWMESRELNLVKKWIRVYKISNTMKILSNLGQFGDDEFSGQIFSLRQYEANYCLWIDLTYLTLCRSLSQLGFQWLVKDTAWSSWSSARNPLWSFTCGFGCKSKLRNDARC